MNSDERNPIEIERKFLVSGDEWRDSAIGVFVRQGYLAQTAALTIRARLGGGRGHLAIKEMTTGIARAEFEYEIPAGDAESLLENCGGRLIEKTRYRVPYQGHVWEVDEFGGANASLVIAEIELEAEDESFERPEWLGNEVSHVGRYYNVNLSQRPFASWTDRERDPGGNGEPADGCPEPDEADPPR